jgi:hypothetical protein
MIKISYSRRNNVVRCEPQKFASQISEALVVPYFLASRKSSTKTEIFEHNIYRGPLFPSPSSTTMRCLRRSVPVPPTHSPKHTRIIHTTPRSLISFIDEYEPKETISPKRIPKKADVLAYAKQTSERGFQRWQESQDPLKKVQFLTMGREFTFPYNLTQYSYMSLNHMRELRAYYRKIMYEMPQFARKYPIHPLNRSPSLNYCVVHDADGRICSAV